MNVMTKGLLAATALITLPSIAQAAVVVSNVSITVPNNISGVYVNVITGANGTTATAGWDFNAYGSSASGLNFFASGTGVAIVGTTATGQIAADLTPGSVVSASSFLRTGVVTGDLIRPGGNHIVGFSFFNEATGAVNYGYARITTTTGTGGNAGFPATITQFAYDNAGQAILVVGNAGAVPEPATWALMMLGFGAMGFSLRRRPMVTARVQFS